MKRKSHINKEKCNNLWFISLLILENIIWNWYEWYFFCAHENPQINILYYLFRYSISLYIRKKKWYVVDLLGKDAMRRHLFLLPKFVTLITYFSFMVSVFFFFCCNRWLCNFTLYNREGRRYLWSLYFSDMISLLNSFPRDFLLPWQLYISPLCNSHITFIVAHKILFNVLTKI